MNTLRRPTTRDDARRLLPWAVRIGFLLCVLTLAALQGCAINRESASVSPDVDLSHLKKFYVAKFAPDGRGINILISDELTRLGFESSTGLDIDAPKDVDAIVTYEDKWQWDITMYMIGLKIYMREPGSNRLLAVGNSFHTSLTRKSPKEMVAEVLSNTFKKAQKAP
jgi:hypothetical protein